MVEAESALMQRMAWILLEAGYETAKISYASEAIDRLRNYTPDIIIFNNDLPDEHKRTCVHELKAILPTVRILDLHSAGHPVQITHDTGADEYLHLPFDADSLLEKVAALTA
jgi:DNA-binding response OmpR family regulator